jgi:hypothetical protein
MFGAVRTKKLSNGFWMEKLFVPLLPFTQNTIERLIGLFHCALATHFSK